MDMSKASCWYVSVSACCVLQETHVAMAVVAVEAWRPSAAHKLVLADTLSALRTRAAHGAVDNLIQHLRQLCRVQRVYEIPRNSLQIIGGRSTGSSHVRF